MSLRFLTGFDMKDAALSAAGVDGSFSGAAGSFVAAARPGSLGDTCVRLGTTQSYVNMSAPNGPTGPASTWLRFWFRVGALPAAGSMVAWLQSLSWDGTHAYCLGVTSTGAVVVLQNGTGAVATSSGTPCSTTNTWYKVDIRLDVDSSVAANNALTVSIDGTQAVTFATGVVKPSAFFSFGLANYLFTVSTGALGTGGLTIDYDDFTWRDSEGTTNNTAPTDSEQLTMLLPTSDNAIGNWTAGAGATTSLFDAVNNRPPVGAATATNTSQIKNVSKTVPSTYTANCAADAGITAGSNVLAMQATAWMGSSQTKTAITDQIVVNGTAGASNSQNGTMAAWPSGWISGNYVTVSEFAAATAVSSTYTLGITKTTATTSDTDVCALFGYLLTAPSGTTLSRSGSDSAGATDAAVRGAQSRSRASSDSLGAADVATRITTLPRTVVESVGGSDVAIKGATVRSGTDSAGATDGASVARALRVLRAAADKAAAKDQPSKITDNFSTGSAGSSLSGAATSDGTATWVQVSGGWQKTGSGTVKNNSFSSNGFAYLETSQSDGTLSFVVGVQSANIFGALFRYIDTANFWAVSQASGTNAASLYFAWTGHALTATGTAFTVVPGDAVTVSFVGSSITVSVNGTVVSTVTNSQGSTGTKVGLYDQNGSGGTPTVGPLTFTSSDATAPTGRVGKGGSASDSAGGSDVATRGIQGGLTTSDSAPASDAATRRVTAARAASDAAAATDSVSAHLGKARTTSDSLAGTDVATRAGLSTARTSSDSASATDSAAATVTASRTSTDSAPAADSATRSAPRTRAVSDSLNGSDSTARVARTARTTADSLPLTDVAKPPSSSRTGTDTAAATDATSRIVVDARTSSDSAPETDVVTRNAGRSRTSTDTAAAADSTLRGVVEARSTADSAPAVDTAHPKAQPTRAADTTGGTDSPARVSAFARSSSDSAPASDGPLRPLSLSRLVNDSAPTVETLVRSAEQFARAASDTLGVTDASAPATRRTTYLRPDSMVTETNFTGPYTYLRDSPDAGGDTSWVLGSAVQGVVHVTMEDPPTTLLVGAGLQRIRVRVKVH